MKQFLYIKSAHYFLKMCTTFLSCLNYDRTQIFNDMKLNRIRVVLADKGISQTWLAKKLGRSFSTVNAYVCNRSQPNLTTLLEIAQLLSVDMKELITNEKERNV